MRNYAFEVGTPEEKKRKQAQFVKDIISMANTPRDGSAYIVLGVRSFPDGRKISRWRRTNVFLNIGE